MKLNLRINPSHEAGHSYFPAPSTMRTLRTPKRRQPRNALAYAAVLEILG
jgi:hypothetical protein